MTRRLRENGPAFALAGLLAFGLKLAYSRLGPDQLTWMSGPTQALVSLLTGVGFTYEDGYGYVSLAHRFVIAKSCTGMNYWLVVFAMLAFTCIPAVASRRGKLLAAGALAAVSYGLTVVVNALRIAAGLALHDGGVGGGWLTPGRVHRAAGILIYFVALVGVHALARRALRRPAGEPGGERWGGRWGASVVAAPLFWYGFVAVVVPLLNGALAARPRLFAEHCAWVLLLSLALAAPFALAAWHRRRRRPRGPRAA
jgi:exosortase K